MIDLISRSWLVAAAIALLVAQATAQEDPSAAAPDAEQQAAMEAWANAGRIGEAHAVLAEQAGEWRAEMEMWMSPDAPPVEATYEVTRTMELEGRVLHEVWTGEFMGQPFHGIGRTGHNNTTEQYWSTWTDNMSTNLMTSSGKLQSDGSIQMTGDFVDPVSGETVATRFVWSIPGADSERMEAYETRGGEEFMNMRMMLNRIED